jgi:hypothetical protein
MFVLKAIHGLLSSYLYLKIDGIIGMYHYSMCAVQEKDSLTFSLDWLWTMILLISSFWVYSWLILEYII